MQPSNFVKIKDPIYGYIEIEEDDDVKTIINSVLFHRLENVIQTSYSSVYPSSVHNRFIHSIGVYYLGSLAIKGIEKNCDDKIKKEIEEYKRTFKLACLLHDLGHSPFSHTGEVYYDYVKETPWDRLMKELSDEEFDNDGNNLGKHPGAAHERMSALESIIAFKSYIQEKQRSFFVRCIIGLKYKNKTDIRNCFIELLNSSTIDVDKLDYLIRDRYFTGFKSVSIDYERLLGSVCIVKNNDDEYILGFTKTGLSTLESVILAHDMERKWIQGHPVIQYECFLLDSIIYKIVKKYKEQNIELFSLEALTEKGLTCGDGKVVRLLSDADILFTAKNELYDSNAVQEYFNRDKRKRSLCDYSGVL
ncbi:HD domain-containing protein [Fibrobacter sp.]|uniref:HD domain-containing protein n=1 Tax=Fibrobacter sp. TaxID=35828 RepID=UPI00388D7472